ncbi:hypothetical protein PMKS-001349 [Pichia membranifaciens]|uniref:Dipeptidyl aminopeptidase n=1 Tax=Pichia membranifaciens TaxID=4926 RepID=A0A1Q2YEG6_9ASCO|nr:hypothetical protein PMKS-001349 [Pichia membranifaciens]
MVSFSQDEGNRSKGDTHTAVDDRSFSLEDEDDMDINDFDMNGIEEGNPEIDYYPGMSNRHSFLGEPDDFKTKLQRFVRKAKVKLSSQNFRKLVIGMTGMGLALLFFAIMFFSGNGRDSLVPGGAVHDGNNADPGPVSEPTSEESPEMTNPGGEQNNNGEYVDLVKMDLEDLRKGSFWIFDYQLNFIDYQPVGEEKAPSIESRDHHGDHDDDDKEEDDDDDDDDDDDNDDDDDDDHKDREDKKEKDKNGKSDDKNTESSQSGPKSSSTNSDAGYYLHQDNSILLLKKASDPDYVKKIIDLSSLTYNSTPLKSRLVSVTKSLERIIVVSDTEQQWRQSSLGKYWLVDVNTLQVEPINAIQEKDDSVTLTSINYAAFSPDGKFVYYNYKSNILLQDLKSGKTTQVTKDGDMKNILNGKPDWIYEEEVLGSDRAIYWCKDDSKFAFIKWDDTDVPVYNLEMFGDDEYPQIEELKYPKTGFPNPIVSLYVYQTTNSKLIKVKQPEEQNKDAESLGKDFIIYQTVWLNEEELLFKRTDRTSRKVQVCVYSTVTGKTLIVRTMNTDKYKGWYKNNGDIFVLPDNKGYIDNVVLANHDHLSHFKNSSDGEGDIVSYGEWDVIGGIVGYDNSENSAYFIGTSGNSLQRQIYKVSLNESSLMAITALDQIHSYSLKVSQGGKWGLMKYAGPQLPTQKIVELNKLLTGLEYYESLPNLNNAFDVEATLGNYQVPTKDYIPIHLHDNVTVNVVEVKPIGFDENRQYPVLVSVYGGPGIQKVNCDFSYGFEEIVSSSADAIILYIDPRGTGGSGWDYRAWARDNIGYWEPRDIVEATQQYIEDRPYVDTERVAIWGWSYGGFVTLKTLEYDMGQVFKYGMAVAPVTNWHLYDSIYTERYMGNPSQNEYKDAKISNYKNFEHIYRFLIMHGTGDDNVHYQNTLQLLNQFDLTGIENYDVHVFPDSDHSIAHDNANVIVYDKLYSWILTAFAT